MVELREEWFGWRIVGKSGLGHAFTGVSKTERFGYPKAGEPSICGRARYGPAVKSSRKYRPCRKCEAAWAKKYPK